jgi:hypothetical protein
MATDAFPAGSFLARGAAVSPGHVALRGAGRPRGRPLSTSQSGTNATGSTSPWKTPGTGAGSRKHAPPSPKAPSATMRPDRRVSRQRAFCWRSTATQAARASVTSVSVSGVRNGAMTERAPVMIEPPAAVLKESNSSWGNAGGVNLRRSPPPTRIGTLLPEAPDRSAGPGATRTPPGVRSGKRPGPPAGPGPPGR